jgi:hypothetical protein
VIPSRDAAAAAAAAGCRTDVQNTIFEKANCVHNPGTEIQYVMELMEIIRHRSACLRKI